VRHMVADYETVVSQRKSPKRTGQRGKGREAGYTLVSRRGKVNVIVGSKSFMEVTRG